VAIENNQEIARRFVEEVWGQGNVEVVREIVDENILHHRRRSHQEPGIEGLLQGIRMYDTAYPRRTFVQEDVIAEGDYVADRWRMEALHEGPMLGIPPTGRQVILTGMNRYLIRGGKIVEAWHDEDIFGMVQQLGGLPGPSQPAGGWPPSPSDAYRLPGPQVEPDASFWTVDPCPVPRVVRLSRLTARTDTPNDPLYFPPYPGPEETSREIEELAELASRLDDPEALVGGEGERKRLAISPFLQLRPQPLGAVYNRQRDAALPVITTGRELARWFESETPGLGYRHALNHLLRDMNWSPPRQALVWMTLDVAIYSAMLAAWHYKWFSERDRVGYRPRPAEVDYRVRVLFNTAVNATGSGDGDRRLQPLPSPGTPRHPSYPSGHSTLGGAASEILSYYFPDYTAEFDQLADNAGMARLWAGIHYRSDHLQGVRLGRSVARLIIEELEVSCLAPAPPWGGPDPHQPPPTREQIRAGADRRRRCCEDRGGPAGPHQGGAAASSAATREQARGPQEGTSPPAGSSKEALQSARGPQQGAAGYSSRERAKEQARGPQEGAK